MKRFICLMIFAIGLMVGLPEQSAGSGSPPDQLSFTINQVSVDMPAMDINQVIDVRPEEFVFVVDHSLSQGFLQEKGGAVTGSLEHKRTYLMQAIAVTNLHCLKFDHKYVLNDDFYINSKHRTCSYDESANNRLLIHKSTACGQFRIRADTQLRG